MVVAKYHGAWSAEPQHRDGAPLKINTAFHTRTPAPRAFGLSEAVLVLLTILSLSSMVAVLAVKVIGSWRLTVVGVAFGRCSEEGGYERQGHQPRLLLDGGKKVLLYAGCVEL
jgi:hypothetical protein